MLAIPAAGTALLLLLSAAAASCLLLLASTGAPSDSAVAQLLSFRPALHMSHQSKVAAPANGWDIHEGTEFLPDQSGASAPDGLWDIK